MTITSNIDQTAPQEMTSLQITAVVICIIINFLDGFDVIAIAFAAPEIARDWSLDPAALGIVFSSGLAGMVIGALLLSPLADRFGRRPLILLCLCVISAGMLASAAAGQVEHLMAMRLLTGIGVGGMLSSLTTMVAEYSSERRRQLAISILQSGYPVGGIIAGLTSVYLIGEHGWRSVFVVGGTLSLAMMPLVYLGLPESLDFLFNQRKPETLGRVNTLRKRMKQPQLDALPDLDSLSVQKSSVADIFAPTYLGRTIAIWTCFVMVMSAWYFVINWTPKVLVDAGLSQKVGISGGMLLSIGGVIGGLTVGWLSSWVRVSSLCAGFMITAIGAMAIFGRLEINLTMMLVVAFLIGVLIAGSMIGLYITVPSLYPVRIRNTGTGWALGIGRLGAVAGPYMAGVLIGLDWDRGALYFAMGLPLVISAAALLWLGSNAQSGINPRAKI